MALLLRSRDKQLTIPVKKMTVILKVRPNSPLGNKGELILQFATKADKKAFVANWLKPKNPTLTTTSQTEAEEEEEKFETQLFEWAKENGFLIPTSLPPHSEKFRLLAIYSSNPPKVKALGNFLSKEEWISKQLSPFTMARLGLKGSPKLSKILSSLGVEKKKVELLLSGIAKSASNILGTYTQITNDPEYVQEQGNSIYFSSCQATDYRSKWFGSSNNTEQYCVVYQDLDCLEQHPNSLFLWYVGERMGVDKKGFVARAKLRVLTTQAGKACGLYVDRPYGAHELLSENFHELKAWWNVHSKSQYGCKLPIYVAPLWQREDGQGACFEERYGGRSKRMWCPSASFGYQDTLKDADSFTFFEEMIVSSQSIVKKAYLSRPKQHGVYLCGLKDMVYHAQKGSIVPLKSKPEEKPWRGFNKGNKKMTVFCQLFMQIFKGLLPSDHFYKFKWVEKHRWMGEHIQEKTSNMSLNLIVVQEEDGLHYLVQAFYNFNNLYLSVKQTPNKEYVTTVLKDYPSLGFYAAVSIKKPEEEEVYEGEEEFELPEYEEMDSLFLDEEII
jgi:hypothetical protein